MQKLSTVLSKNFSHKNDVIEKAIFFPQKDHIFIRDLLISSMQIM